MKNITIYMGEGMYQRYYVGKRSPLVNEQKFGLVEEISVIGNFVCVKFEKAEKKFGGAPYSTIEIKKEEGKPQ